jgi:hypothetical protein
MSPADRKSLGLKTDHEKQVANDAKAESEIQRDVENWLRQQGFWPRTPAYLDGKEPERGWYIHLYNTQKNPILLDLLILCNDGRYVEVELKTKTGLVRVEQTAILNTSHAIMARSSIEAIEKIRYWMQKTQTIDGKYEAV